MPSCVGSSAGDVVSGPTVVVEGMAEARKALKAVSKEAQRACTTALRHAMDPVAAKARSYAPKRSGRLAGSIKPYAKAKEAGVIVRGSSAAGAYAGVQEYARKYERTRNGKTHTVTMKEAVGDGRFVNRAGRGAGPDVFDAVTKAVEQAIVDAGLGLEG